MNCTCVLNHIHKIKLTIITNFRFFSGEGLKMSSSSTEHTHTHTQMQCVVIHVYSLSADM